MKQDCGKHSMFEHTSDLSSEGGALSSDLPYKYFNYIGLTSGSPSPPSGSMDLLVLMVSFQENCVRASSCRLQVTPPGNEDGHTGAPGPCTRSPLFNHCARLCTRVLGNHLLWW